METFRSAIPKIDRSLPSPTRSWQLIRFLLYGTFGASDMHTCFGVADPLGVSPERIGLPENPLFLSTKIVLRERG